MIRHVLEDFEGYVTSASMDELQDGTFWSRVTDLDGEEICAQILIEKIPLVERNYISPGALFYWTIYNDGTYDFRFYKEVWTAEQIEAITQRAKELSAFFITAEQAP